MADENPADSTTSNNQNPPIPANQWPDVLRQITLESTSNPVIQQTWFIGLDQAGRGVYHDEKFERIARLVPKHHPAFRDDVDPDGPMRTVLREYQASEGATHPVSGPTNDVLCEISSSKVEGTSHSKRPLASKIATTALAENWHHLSPKILTQIQEHTDSHTYDKHIDGIPEFPIWAGAFTIDQYRD